MLSVVTTEQLKVFTKDMVMFTKVSAYQHRGKFYKMKNKADIHHCDLRELADCTKHSVWT